MKSWKKHLGAAQQQPPRSFPSPTLPGITTSPTTEAEEYYSPQPSGKFVGIDERLLLTGNNTSAGVTLRITVKMFQPNGRYIEPSFDTTLVSTGALTPFPMRVGPGWLVGIIILPIAGSPQLGECFVKVGIFRGDIVSANLQHDIVLQGYISSTTSISSDVQSAVDTSEGTLTRITFSGSMGGAGNEISAPTLITSLRYELKTLLVTYNTDATVANRYVQIEQLASSGGPRIWYCKSRVAQPASTSYSYVFGDVDTDAALLDGTVHVRMPSDVKLLGTQAWRIGASGSAGGDGGSGTLWTISKAI